MKKIFGLFICLAMLVLTVGCDSQQTSDDVTQKFQEMLTQQAVSQVGMPGITNFTELKLMKMLYELRDQKITTYSYVMTMDGKLMHVCDSIGYGLPYATQFSNPMKHVEASHGGNWYQYELPQAEPNGLFMPNSAEGTWVICSAPQKTGGIDPVYIEPRVIVSPHKLRQDGEYEIK